MDANAATGEGPPAKAAVGTAAVARMDEGSPTKDAIGTAMLDRTDTEPVLQVASSMAKNVRCMGAQSSKSIDRLTGKQTPTWRAKATAKGKAPAARLPPIHIPPPLPPAISPITVPSEVPSKASDMWAKLVRNNVLLSLMLKQMGVDASFLGQQCTDRHKADVALFADIRGEMERLGTMNAEGQASLNQHINRLFTLLNDRRESINVLVGKMVLLHDTSELTICMDNLAADLASLQCTAPAVTPPVVPIRGLPTRAAVVLFLPSALPLPPTPYQSHTGLPLHSCGQQSRNGGHQNFGRGGKKRLGPNHAAVAKRPQNEMVNPAHAQRMLSSAHPNHWT